MKKCGLCLIVKFIWNSYTYVTETLKAENFTFSVLTNLDLSSFYEGKLRLFFT